MVAMSLPDLVIDDAVRAALREDLGHAGDITTDAIVPADAQAVARFVPRSAGRLCGLALASRVFESLNVGVVFESSRGDGEDVEARQTIARISGNARAILTGERTALNFLGHLSGIATATRDYKTAVGDHGAEIVATRKTTPGLRALEKYAVRIGGGGPHRYGLFDAVLIKDNHIAIAGSLRKAIEKARAGVGHLVKIQVEVDTLDQLRELLEVGADAVLLDNMSLEELEAAVLLCRGRMVTEASGGMTLERIADVAATGVDQISVGALTHSAASLDIGLDIELGVD